MFDECWAIIRQGLTSPTVDFSGEFYRFKDVPMELTPFQAPHPALWYGVARPDSAVRAAQQRLNFVMNATLAGAKAIVDAYRAALPAGAGAPLMGLNQFVVVAPTDQAALDIARPAYRRWHASFHSLWNKHGVAPVSARYPAEFDEQVAEDRAVAGSVDTVDGRLAAADRSDRRQLPRLPLCVRQHRASRRAAQRRAVRAARDAGPAPRRRNAQ